MDVGVTPALRRRRERAERQRSLIREQEEAGRRSSALLDDEAFSPAQRKLIHLIFVLFCYLFTYFISFI